MNIETLHQYANTFTREVVTSGFKRDLTDYLASAPALQNNILGLREMAANALASLNRIYAGDLPEALSALLPNTQIRPFTETPYDQELKALIENSEIPQDQFFEQLNSLLTRIRRQIDQNATEITKIEEFIVPYVAEHIHEISEQDSAIVAIIFNNHATITSLGQFAKTVACWNRILPVYHQLLKSESPEEIEIVEVQNGSIDLIVNLDVDVAVNLAELFKLGFQMFAAYLSYKKMIKPIIDSYHGNVELIAGEEKRENLMLANIGEAVKQKVLAQHKAAKKADKNVDGVAITKKVEQVTLLITSHIVQGNDLKLLALPEQDFEEPLPEGEAEPPSLADELREESATARRALRELPGESKQLLLEAYGQMTDEPETQAST